VADAVAVSSQLIHLLIDVEASSFEFKSEQGRKKNEEED